MIPTGECWAPITIGSAANAVPHGVDEGDRLTWINGSWVPVPASRPRATGCGCGCGSAARLKASDPVTLVQTLSGARQPSSSDKSLPLFEPSTGMLYRYDAVSDSWRTADAPQTMVDVYDGTVVRRGSDGHYTAFAGSVVVQTINADGNTARWMLKGLPTGSPIAVVDKRHDRVLGPSEVTISSDGRSMLLQFAHTPSAGDSFDIRNYRI